MSAPASLNSCSASGVSRNSIPTCSSTVSAFSSISDRCSSDSTSNGFSVRVMYGTLTAFEMARAACRAARPPLRRPPVVSVIRALQSCRAPLGGLARAAPAPAPLGRIGNAAWRQGDGRA
jgi:hypothetical protein